MKTKKIIRYRIKDLMALKRARVLTRFVANCKKYKFYQGSVYIIHGAFIWMDTKEGSMFWKKKLDLTHDLINNLDDNSHVTIKEFRALNKG